MPADKRKSAKNRTDGKAREKSRADKNSLWKGILGRTDLLLEGTTGCELGVFILNKFGVRIATAPACSTATLPTPTTTPATSGTVDSAGDAPILPCPDSPPPSDLSSKRNSPMADAGMPPPQLANTPKVGGRRPWEVCFQCPANMLDMREDKETPKRVQEITGRLPTQVTPDGWLEVRTEAELDACYELLATMYDTAYSRLSTLCHSYQVSSSSDDCDCLEIDFEPKLLPPVRLLLKFMCEWSFYNVRLVPPIFA